MVVGGGVAGLQATFTILDTKLKKMEEEKIRMSNLGSCYWRGTMNTWQN